MLVPGLERDAHPPTATEVAAAVNGADVVIVENLLSLPLNKGAWRVAADVLRGRPTVLRHHDLPWQRSQFAEWGPPPDDATWTHVTVNARSRDELATYGVEAVVRRNRFPLDGWDSDGAATRQSLGLEGRVLLHPVRAIRRKNVPAALRLADALQATYWLTGPAEDGYERELEAALSAARVPVVRAGVGDVSVAYAASDAVAFPSTVEGFGNPVIESALARRPLAVHRYPGVDELAAFGFRWFDPAQPAPLDAFLRDPDPALLDDNEATARANFGLDGLPADVASVLERVL